MTTIPTIKVCLLSFVELLLESGQFLLHRIGTLGDGILEGPGVALDDELLTRHMDLDPGVLVLRLRKQGKDHIHGIHTLVKPLQL